MKNKLSKTVLSFFSELCFHVMLCYCKGYSSDTKRYEFEIWNTCRGHTALGTGLLSFNYIEYMLC